MTEYEIGDSIGREFSTPPSRSFSISFRLDLFYPFCLLPSVLPFLPSAFRLPLSAFCSLPSAFCFLLFPFCFALFALLYLFCFQSIPNCPSCNSFVLITMQIAGGGGTSPRNPPGCLPFRFLKRWAALPFIGDPDLEAPPLRCPLRVNQARRKSP